MIEENNGSSNALLLALVQSAARREGKGEGAGGLTNSDGDRGGAAIAIVAMVAVDGVGDEGISAGTDGSSGSGNRSDSSGSGGSGNSGGSGDRARVIWGLVKGRCSPLSRCGLDSVYRIEE